MAIERGKDVTDRFTTDIGLPRVPPPDDGRAIPIPTLTDAAAAEIERLEDEARTKLAQKYGPNYEESTTAWRIKFSDLDKPDRERIVERLEELRGMRGLLDEGIGPRMIQDVTASNFGDDIRPFGRFTVSLAQHLAENHGHIDPNLIWYANTSIQYFGHQFQGALGEAANSDFYKAAGRQLTHKATQSIASQLETLYREGLPQRYSVFDVETPGLNITEGVHELSVRAYENGAPIEGEAATFHFPNNFMRLGVAGPDNLPLDEFIARMTHSEFADFGNSTKRFLETLKRADWNVVGHNIPFDFERLLYGMKRTSQYSTDSEYKSLVDEFEHVFVRSQAKVYDTNILASLLMPGLEVAPELQSRGSFTPHSLENILLQTDFLDQLAAEPNGPSARELGRLLTRKRTHSAEVDTLLEGELYRHLVGMIHGSSTLNPSPLGRGKWRRAISQSLPIGPRIRMRYEDVADELRPLLRSQGLINEADRTTRITPLEQMVLLSRRNTPIDVQNLDLLGTMARMRQFHQRIFTPSGRVGPAGETYSPPTLGEWRVFQEEMITQGVPFSQLSYMERQATQMLAGVMSPTTIAGEMPNEARQALAEYFGRIHLQGASQVEVFGSGGIRMPTQLLEEALGQTESLQKFELSPFEFTPKFEGARPLYNMGAMFHGTDEELNALREFVQNNIGRYGITAKIAEQVAENLNTGRGVQVASLVAGPGVEGGPIAQLVQNLRGFMGVDVDRAKDNKWSLSILHRPGSQPDDAGLQRFGVVVQDTGLTPDFVDALLHEDDRATELLQDTTKRLTREQTTQLQNVALRNFRTGKIPVRTQMDEVIEAATENLTGTTPREQIVQRANEIYDTFTKPALKGGAAAAVLALGGYYLYKRHNENKKYNETIAAMPYEENSQGPRAQQYQTGYLLPTTPVAKQGMDTLRTAGVVNSQYQNRIGHYRMGGSDKYSYLYGSP